MENLFERLGSMLKDYINDDNAQKSRSGQPAAQSAVKPAKVQKRPAIQPEQEENAPSSRMQKQNRSRAGDTAGTGKNTYGDARQKRRSGIVYKMPPPQLLEDFNVLGFSSYTDFQSCKKRYKELLHAHHPDKYADGTAEQEAAHTLTIKIRSAFKNIEDWFVRNGHSAR